MAGEESTVDVHAGVKIPVSFLHHESVRLPVHQGEHPLCVATYHAAVSPGDYRGERPLSDVGQRFETTGKLYGIVGYEFRAVYSCSLGIKEVLLYRCLPLFVLLLEKSLAGFLSSSRATSGRTVRRVDTNAGVECQGALFPCRPCGICSVWNEPRAAGPATRWCLSSYAARISVRPPGAINDRGLGLGHLRRPCLFSSMTTGERGRIQVRVRLS